MIALSWTLSATGLSNQEIARVLHWQPKPNTLCKGTFSQNPRLSPIKNPPRMNQARTTITAQKQTRFSQKGTSELRGNVRLSQPGRELTADKISLMRNPKSLDIDRIELRGNVQFEEHDRLITSKFARADLSNNTLCTQCSAFRGDHPTPLETLHAWGDASRIFKDAQGNITLTNARYSVCPIMNPTWEIRAKEIHLNKHNGVGQARGATLYLHGVPVFYLPYLSYPIKQARKSGFLLPGLGFDESDGFSIDIPYYFNLAPNYDALLSLNYMTQRGVKFNGEYRYLTQQSHGKLFASFLPRDTEFLNFQRESKVAYAGMPAFQPFLSRINNAGSDRYTVDFNDTTRFDPHWGGSLRLHYVSDDYYLQDFGVNPLNSNKNQLLNQAELHFHDIHWQLLARAMGYQTLHPIGSMNPEPYSRLPQIAASAFYPRELLGLDYELFVDYTNFDHRNDFVSNAPVVSAHRMHIRPGIIYNWQRPWGYVRPQLRLDATGYWLRNQSATQPDDISRVLPIAAVDTGLIFERHGHCYRQTLEPRLYYLWVPKKNQDDIPIFDTSLPRFSFEQLFHYNRFTGQDRFGDANQVTLGLTSHWYEQATGIERFSTSLGILYQFQKRSVSIKPDGSDDPTRNQKLSPLLMNATYRLSQTSYAQADLAWSPRDQRTETGNVRLHYEPKENHILHFGYDFVRTGDPGMDSRNQNLSRIDVGFSWPAGPHWGFMANWNYNLSHSHIQHYLAGISYNSCCWAMRMVVTRTLLDVAYSDNADYDNKYFLEIKLKGLGTLGNGRPSSMLNQSILGYHDRFS